MAAAKIAQPPSLAMLPMALNAGELFVGRCKRKNAYNVFLTPTSDALITFPSIFSGNAANP
jgi:hypothetical protein